MLSIAFAGANQNQDTGAKMIHNAPNTSSSIISKSIAKNGGAVNYRGQVTFGKNSKKSASHIECDTILMDDLSKSDTVFGTRGESVKNFRRTTLLFDESWTYRKRSN